MISKKTARIFKLSRLLSRRHLWANVYPVQTLKEACKLAEQSPGTVVTDIPVYEPEKIGLVADSKVLLFNDGAVKGRCAAARRIFGGSGVDAEEYAIKIRDAIYDTRYKNMY